MPKQESPGSKFDYKARIAVLEDGSIQNRKIERYILFQADGLDRAQAWRLAFPGAEVNNTYRRRIEADGTYRARLAALIQENEELEAQSPWGGLVKQARMAYRHAVAKDDLNAMIRATDMAAKMTDRLHGGNSPIGSAGSDDAKTPGAGPGRPATESQKAVKSPEEIMSKLLRLGRDQQAASTDEAA